MWKKDGKNNIKVSENYSKSEDSEYVTNYLKQIFVSLINYLTNIIRKIYYSN